MSPSTSDDAKRHVDFFDLIERDIQELKRRVLDLESNQTWTVRVLVGAVLMALMGFVLKNGAIS